MSPDAGDSLVLKTENLERLRIDASGNVGIGTTEDPSARLDVAGAVKADAVDAAEATFADATIADATISKATIAEVHFETLSMTHVSVSSGVSAASVTADSATIRDLKVTGEMEVD